MYSIILIEVYYYKRNTRIYLLASAEKQSNGKRTDNGYTVGANNTGQTAIENLQIQMLALQKNHEAQMAAMQTKINQMVRILFNFMLFCQWVLYIYT